MRPFCRKTQAAAFRPAGADRGSLTPKRVVVPDPHATIRKSALLSVSGLPSRMAKSLAALPPRPSTSKKSSPFGPTQRESEAAVLLAQGLTPEAIAGRTGIGVASVRQYLKRIFEKTGARSRAALVALFARLHRTAPPRHRVAIRYAGSPSFFASALIPTAKVFRPTVSLISASFSGATSNSAVHSTNVLLPSVIGLQVKVAM